MMSSGKMRYSVIQTYHIVVIKTCSLTLSGLKRVNPFNLNGLSNPYQLEKFISNFKILGLYFFFYFFQILNRITCKKIVHSYPDYTPHDVAS